MPTPLVFFCRNPLDPHKVEPIYSLEYEIAQKLGFETALLEHDYLDREINPGKALGKRSLPEGPAIYRGWMMNYGAYRALYEELSARGITLLTNPEEYRRLHYSGGDLISALREYTPKTVVIPKFNPHEVVTEDDFNDWIQDEVMMELASAFGNDEDEPVPVVLKDYVKSQADYWKDACFIPDALDQDAVVRVMSGFQKLQGGWDNITGGWVFRQWLDLALVGRRVIEYRAFIVNGELVGCWPRSMPLDISPPHKMLVEIADAISSPFATADFAIENKTGRWWLIECGDGQVSSIPPYAIEPVFEALKGI